MKVKHPSAAVCSYHKQHVLRIEERLGMRIEDDPLRLREAVSAYHKEQAHRTKTFLDDCDETSSSQDRRTSASNIDHTNCQVKLYSQDATLLLQLPKAPSWRRKPIIFPAEQLPFDVKCHILCSFDDLNSLKSLIVASADFYEVFKVTKATLAKVYQKEITEQRFQRPSYELWSDHIHDLSGTSADFEGFVPGVDKVYWDAMEEWYNLDMSTDPPNKASLTKRKPKASTLSIFSSQTSKCYPLPNTNFTLSQDQFIAHRIFYSTGISVDPKEIAEYRKCYAWRLCHRCLRGDLREGDSRRIRLSDSLQSGGGRAPHKQIAHALSFLFGPFSANFTAGKAADDIAANIITVEELYNWQCHYKGGRLPRWNGFVGLPHGARSNASEAIRSRAAVVDIKLTLAGYREVMKGFHR